MQAASFYGFHIKTVRSPIENRTFSIWKPYGFQLENVKVRLLKADYEPFNHVLVHIRSNKFIEENENSFSQYFGFYKKMYTFAHKALVSSALCLRRPAPGCL